MGEKTYRDAIREAIIEEMRRDEDVFIIGEDICKYGGAFGVTRELVKEFGEMRVRSTPIAELGGTCLGVGAAMMGLRPIVEIMYVDFMLLALDQIVNEAAKMRYRFGGQVTVPMVIRAPQGAGRGTGAHHSQSLEAMVYGFPGIKIAIPSNAYDAKGLLKTAIRDDNPVIFFESKQQYGEKGEVPDEDYSIPFGKANIVREGKDITIIAIASMVNEAVKAAEELEKRNISCEVIDIRTLYPLDIETLEASLIKTGRLIVAAEAIKLGGVQGNIVAQLMETKAFYHLDAPPVHIGAKLSSFPFNRKLEKALLPSFEDILSVVKERFRI
jgi:pyruvate dehydrogenase E1 component beta subunit